jgi:hypothetical protein
MYLMHMPLPSTPTPRVPPVGPALIDVTLEILGRSGVPTSRGELVAFVMEQLPGTIGAGSRARFARYLTRPYLRGQTVDRAALALLGAPLREQTKRQYALVRLAEVEPAVGRFLDERLPDPNWRWFPPRRLRRWLAELRGSDDPTSASRLASVLRAGGYLRRFDRGWVVDPPPPSPAVLLDGVLREIGAPGQTTVARLFETRIVTRTLAPAGALYRMLDWAAAQDLIRWADWREPVVWLPRGREETIARLVDRALPEPSLT